MAAGIEIVRLRAGDESRILRSEGLFDEPASSAAAKAYLEDERNVFFLAVEGDRPVGFLRGSALIQLKNDRLQMFLYEIAVDDDYRRRGIARRLVSELIQYCRDRDFEEIFVFTDPSNGAAVGLYQSTGAVTETPADRMFVYQLSAR